MSEQVDGKEDVTITEGFPEPVIIDGSPAVAEETKVEAAVKRAKAMTIETGELVVLGAPFTFGANGLTVNGKGKNKPTFEQAASAFERLCRVQGSVRFNRGDLLRYIEEQYGEQASQIVSPEIIEEREASEERHVTKHVAVPEREMAKSWDHAKAVADLPKAQQRKYLQLSLDEEWTAAKLKTEAQAAAHKDGKAGLKFWLVVECGSEAKQEKVAADLEAQGFTVKKKSGVKREKKAKAPRVVKFKREKKGPVTAQKRRVTKMSARKRVPK